MSGDISKYYLFVQRKFRTVENMVKQIDESEYGNNDGFLIKNEAHNYFEDKFDTVDFNSSDFNAFWRTVDVERGGNILGGNIQDLNALNEDEIKMMQQKFRWFELLNKYMQEEWKYPDIDSKYKEYISETMLYSSVYSALEQSVSRMFEEHVDDTTPPSDAEIMMSLRISASTCTKECSAEIFQEFFAMGKFNEFFDELDYRISDDDNLKDIVSKYINNIKPSSNINTILSDLEKIILAYLDTADNDNEITAQGIGALNDYIYKGPYLNDLQKAVIMHKFDESFKNWKEYKNAGNLQGKYDWAIGIYENELKSELDTTYCTPSNFEKYAKTTNFIAEFQKSNAYKGLEVYKRYLNPVIDETSPYYNFWEKLETAVNGLLADTNYTLQGLIDDGTWAKVISEVAELYASGGGTPCEEMPTPGSGTAPNAVERGNGTKGVCPTPAPATPAPWSPTIPQVDILKGKNIIGDIINTLKKTLHLNGTQGGGDVNPNAPVSPPDNPNNYTQAQLELFELMKEDLAYDDLPEFLKEICNDVFDKYITTANDNEINKFLRENKFITAIEPFKSLEKITAIFKNTKYQNSNLTSFCNELFYGDTYNSVGANEWFADMVRAILSEDDNDDKDYPVTELENIIRRMFDVVETRGGGGPGSGSEVDILDMFAAEIDLLWCQYAKTEDGEEPDLTTIMSRMGCSLGNDTAYDDYLGRTTLKRVISLLITNGIISDDPKDEQYTIKDLFDKCNENYFYGNYSGINTSNYETVIDSLSFYAINQFIFDIAMYGMDFDL